MFEPDWAWALNLEKGATDVGQKRFAQFSVLAEATFDSVKPDNRCRPSPHAAMR
jgi:hypothetical protein